MHYLIGNLGHLLVITAFVTSVLSSFAYWKATTLKEIEEKNSWLINARVAFVAHVIGIVGIVAVLFTIIYQHYFEYHYAYSHSSLHLPGQYMLSCFWEGQEGSFLLWMFWHAIIGLI
ncbi:MAG: cytochrome C biogenesis protein, partial [Cyclobacteriaceae bacterium]|nr:cytochrome C biogenesis protein [Cyclobacteriaceae bacterium]